MLSFCKCRRLSSVRFKLLLVASYFFPPTHILLTLINNLLIFLLFCRGVCTAAPCYCIVMEYCPYGPLYNLLKDGQDIPPDRVANWAKEIASGMNYLHQHKIIHRDLKSPK